MGDLVTKYGGGLPLGRSGKAGDKSSSFSVFLEDLFIPQSQVGALLSRSAVSDSHLTQVCEHTLYIEEALIADLRGTFKREQLNVAQAKKRWERSSWFTKKHFRPHSIFREHNG